MHYSNRMVNFVKVKLFIDTKAQQLKIITMDRICLYAFSKSVFAIRAPTPISLTAMIASWIDWYLTVQKSYGIL